MAENQDVAYCGLYCGDCVIRKGELASVAGRLLASIQTVEFDKMARGLPEIFPEVCADLKDYPVCMRVLKAMMFLDCTQVCRAGGGSTHCAIRACCRTKGYDGCWQCDGFETCQTLAWLEPVHCGGHLENIRVIREKGMQAFLAGDIPNGHEKS